MHEGNVSSFKFEGHRHKTWLSQNEISVVTVGYLSKTRNAEKTKISGGARNMMDGGVDVSVRSYGSGRVKRISERFIPKYIAVRGSRHDRIVVVPMPISDYFFVGVGPEAPSGPMLVGLYGTAMRGYSLYLGGGKSAMYCAFDNYVVGINRDAMCEFTFALSDVVDYNYAKCAQLDSLIWPLAAEAEDSVGAAVDGKLWSQFAKKCENLPASKVTASHHVHYYPEEIARALESQQSLQFNILLKLLRLPDMHKAAMSGFILWLSALNGDVLRTVSRFSCWDAPNLEKLAVSLKKTVRLAKLLQNNVREDLLPIFEAEVLVNRGIGEVDWAGERQHRERPDVTRLASPLVYERALKILQDGKHDRGRFPKMDWAQYWNTRWQFTPTGSIKSQYAEDLADLPDDFRLRNKFVALNTTQLVNFEDWVGREPSIHAWSSYKYEWGKQRAIYGCDVTNFVLTNFCMFKCEDRLPPKFPVGSRAEPQYVARSLGAVLDGAEPFCFDFEDFNSQHSTGAMKAVLRAYNDTYRGDMSPEQQLAMDWVIRSMDEMIVHDNLGGQGTYRANGTLFSGWRLTTFMNSVLNAVYSEEVYDSTDAKYPMRSVHNGDDIILGMHNAVQAKNMLLNAVKLNIRAQPTKCAFGAVAEFLRVDRRACSGGQYLPRAVATLVHSRVESGPAMSISDAIRSNETRLSEFVDRGGQVELALRLRRAYLDRVAPLFGNTTDEALRLLEASSVIGGLSMSREAPVEWTVTEAQVSRAEEKDTMLVKGNRAWRGISDMSNEIYAKVSPYTGGSVTVSDINKRVYNSTLRALSLSRRRANISPTHDTARARNWREHRGTFKTLRASGTLGLARLAGVTIDINRPSDGELELLLIKAGQSVSPMTFVSLAT